MTTDKRVRVRFAPSPTGKIHIGGLRTALYNYLFAKKHGGDFILRIEDTDTARTVPGADQYIVESLKWLGIVPNEGYGFSGFSGQYMQSKRAEAGIYQKYVNALILSGDAYYAFDTTEEIEAMKIRLKDLNLPIISYSHYSRMSMRNSLTMSKEVVKELIDNKVPYVVRFKMPELSQKVIVNDLIRGKVEFNTSLLDDKVLVKSDGIPTYHLANVVDDYEMQISHVIRGEEWLPSAALHMMIYEALGYKNETPTFIHLPLILKPNGKGKISKRDGVGLGAPIFPFSFKDEFGNVIDGYKDLGFLPQAINNMMALIGWHPGAGIEQEIFSLDELASMFSFDHVQLSGARYNPDKAIWFNQQYLKMMTDEELVDEFKKLNIPEVNNASDAFILKVVKIIRHKIKYVSDLYKESEFLFKRPEKTDYDFDSILNIKDLDMVSIANAISNFAEGIEVIESPTEQDIEKIINDACINASANAKHVKQMMMVCVYGKKSGPGLYSIFSLFTVLESLKRLTIGMCDYNLCLLGKLN